jgi:hypothetical protein
MHWIDGGPIQTTAVYFFSPSRISIIFRKILSVPDPQRRRPRHRGINFKRAKNFGNAPLHEDEGKSANRLT